MTDYAATALVFPSSNDLFGAGVAGDGVNMREGNLADRWLANLFAQNCVISGLALPASSGNLTLTVPVGKAYLAGRFLDVASTVITCAASVTNHIFLKITRDAGLNAAAVKYEVNTTGTAPADSVKLGTATTSGSAVTATADKRTFYKTGTIEEFSGPEDSIPQGTVLANGQAISRTTYRNLHDLYARAGYPYGNGDGSTTFNVPDRRGRVSIGVDGSANRITSASTGGANADTLGGVGGAETHTLTPAQMPSHTHSSTTVASITSPGIQSSGTNDLTQIGTPTGSAGGDAAHNNTQPWLAVNFIVWT